MTKAQEVKVFTAITLGLAMLFCFGGHVLAAGERTATVTMTDGDVQFQKRGVGAWHAVSEGDELGEFDIVKTGSASKAQILFEGQSDSVADLRPGSVMELSKIGGDGAGDDTELFMSLGAVLVKAEKLKGGSKFEVRTPNSIVGIRGTEFEVVVDE